MAPSEPRRALLAGTLTSAPLGLLGRLLLAISEATSNYGYCILLFLPFVTSLVTAQYLHAINAIMLSSALSMVVFATIGSGDASFYPSLLSALPILFGGAVAGAILGLLMRPLIRKMVG